MKRIRRIGLSLVLAVALLVSFAAPALADNPTVSITVTAEVVSITNSKSTWGIGTVTVDAVVYFSTDGSEDADWSQIVNTGSVAVDVQIQGTDLSGTPTWTLASSTDTDQYSLYAYNVTATDYTIEVKSGAYNDIVVDLAADGAYDWSMKFTAPSAFGGTEDGNEKSGTITLVASKH